MNASEGQGPGAPESAYVPFDYQSQQRLVAEDVLFALQGCSGLYLTRVPPESPLAPSGYAFSSKIAVEIANLANRCLDVARYRDQIEAFVEDSEGKPQDVVRASVASAFSDILADFSAFIASLATRIYTTEEFQIGLLGLSGELAPYSRLLKPLAQLGVTLGEAENPASLDGVAALTAVLNQYHEVAMGQSSHDLEMSPIRHVASAAFHPFLRLLVAWLRSGELPEPTKVISISQSLGQTLGMSAMRVSRSDGGMIQMPVNTLLPIIENTAVGASQRFCIAPGFVLPEPFSSLHDTITLCGDYASALRKCGVIPLEDASPAVTEALQMLETTVPLGDLAYQRAQSAVQSVLSHLGQQLLGVLFQSGLLQQFRLLSRILAGGSFDWIVEFTTSGRVLLSESDAAQNGAALVSLAARTALQSTALSVVRQMGVTEDVQKISSDFQRVASMIEGGLGAILLQPSALATAIADTGKMDADEAASGAIGPIRFGIVRSAASETNPLWGRVDTSIEVGWPLRLVFDGAAIYNYRHLFRIILAAQMAVTQVSQAHTGILKVARERDNNSNSLPPTTVKQLLAALQRVNITIRGLLQRVQSAAADAWREFSALENYNSKVELIQRASDQSVLSSFLADPSPRTLSMAHRDYLGRIYMRSLLADREMDEMMMKACNLAASIGLAVNRTLTQNSAAEEGDLSLALISLLSDLSAGDRATEGEDDTSHSFRSLWTKWMVCESSYQVRAMLNLETLKNSQKFKYSNN